MQSQGRGEHAMAEEAAVAAVARTGSSAGLAKSPWRGIGRRLSWSSKILLSGLDCAPDERPSLPIPSHPLCDFEDEPAEDGIPTPQERMAETTASSNFLHGVYGLMRRDGK